VGLPALEKRALADCTAQMLYLKAQDAVKTPSFVVGYLKIIKQVGF
jgi:hypothetical protein